MADGPITLLVPNLERGGAERQAVLLALGLAASGREVSVAAFRAGGPFAADLARAGVEVIDLGGRGALAPLHVAARLADHLRRRRGAVLYAFLPPANLVAGLMRAARPGCRVVWGVRSSDIPLSNYGAKTRLAYALERRMSALCHAIVVNSRAGLEACRRNGFPAAKLHVVANGFEIERFRPDPEMRARTRATWGLNTEEVAIGLPARLDPVKDHTTFLKAARSLAGRQPRARFVAIGGGRPAYVERLHRLAEDFGLGDRVIWTGAVDDMPAAYNALDIATLTSLSEGFPNTMGEAMACGLPCIATDVGDARFLIGPAGMTVPARDPAALAEAWESLFDSERRRALGAAGRERIVREFSVEALVRNSLAVFEAA